MGTQKQHQQKSKKKRSPRSSSTNALHKQQSVATYRSVTPTKEVSEVLGLSNIMAMVSPSNWKTMDGHTNNINNNNNNNNHDGGDKNKSISMDSSEANGMSGGKPALSPPNSSTGIQWIIAALNSGSTACRPPNLNRDECILWDSLQTAMVNDRNEHLSKRRALEHDLQKSSTLLDEVVVREMALEREVTQAKTHRADMEQKYTAMAIVVENHHARKNKNQGDREDNGSYNDMSKREMLNLQLQQIDLLKQELQAKDALIKEQKNSHNTEVMAIHRVMADVTTEKIKLEETVEQQQQQQTKAAAESKKEEHADGTGKKRAIETGVAIPLASISSEEIDKLKEKLEASKEEIEAARLEADTKSEQIKVLESDLKDANLKVSDTIKENKKLTTKNKATTGEIVNDIELDGQLKATVEELKAEVSYQKLETEKLKVEKMETQVAHVSALDEVKSLKTVNELAGQEMEILKREREQAANEVEKLKQENKLAQQDVEKLKKGQKHAANELDKLRKAREHAVNEVDKAIIEAMAIKAEHPTISPSNSTETENNSENGENEKKEKEEPNPGVSLEEFKKLQETLSDTTLSLETSKKIIASLENASGSLALESRSKLKEKDEEISVVQKESEERKRNLDSLATELRDLQRKQGDIECADRRTKVQVIRQHALMDHLESSLTDLQAAVVVHESSVTMLESGISKNSNIEEISEILGDALHAITATLETTEQFVDEVHDSSVVNNDISLSSEVGRHIDAITRNDREAASRGLTHELDQKKVAVKRLEEALKKQNEEMRRLRSQFYTSDNNQLKTEIQRLRQQCTTNMEVLAKKERELSVLRSSLKVDENESGYISDDVSDDEDEDGGTDMGSIISAAKLNAYGPADAEAYATILSQASGRIGLPGNAQIQEVESLKRDLMEALGEKESASKELQARRESLANAKMIISSLEKANKGMMEDLRSRLHDSNTAISSLLDKSKEHEKSADDMREKLQRLEQEKLEERDNYEAELKKQRIESENRNEGVKEVSLEEKKDEVPAFASSS